MYTKVAPLEHSPRLNAGSTGLRFTSDLERPRGLLLRSAAQPAAQNTEAGIPLAVVMLAIIVTTFMTAPVTAQTGASRSTDESIRAAIVLLDQLEQSQTRPIDTANLDGVNELIIAVEKADPTNPWLTYLFGRSFALMGRAGDAIDKLRKFTETREGRNEWKAFRTLGDLFVEQYPQLARAEYRNAEALKANDPTIIFGLSRCAYGIGEPQEALRLARQVAQWGDGRNVRYVSHLARMLIANELWSQADQTTATALEIAQQDAGKNLGRRDPLLVVDQQYQLTIDLLGARIKLRGATVDSSLQLARAIRERANLRRTISLFNVLDILEATIKAGDVRRRPEVLQEYAETLAEVGRTAEAKEQFERLLKLQPGNTSARDWLSGAKPDERQP